MSEIWQKRVFQYRKTTQGKQQYDFPWWRQNKVTITYDDCHSANRQLLITVFTQTLVINNTTVLPAKSDSEVIFCLQLLSKTFTFTRHFSQRGSIDHLCINPILRIGLIHK